MLGVRCFLVLSLSQVRVFSYVVPCALEPGCFQNFFLFKFFFFFFFGSVCFESPYPLVFDCRLTMASSTLSTPYIDWLLGSWLHGSLAVLLDFWFRYEFRYGPMPEKSQLLLHDASTFACLPPLCCLRAIVLPNETVGLASLWAWMSSCLSFSLAKIDLFLTHLLQREVVDRFPDGFSR